LYILKAVIIKYCFVNSNYSMLTQNSSHLCRTLLNFELVIFRLRMKNNLCSYAGINGISICNIWVLGESSLLPPISSANWMAFVGRWNGNTLNYCIKSSVSEENHFSVPRLVFVKITGLISVPLLIMPPLTWILK
jgi:hypothetical protein